MKKANGRRIISVGEGEEKRFVSATKLLDVTLNVDLLKPETLSPLIIMILHFLVQLSKAAAGLPTSRHRLLDPA